MLRCGTAFSEIMLLGKSVQQLSGYTHRISQLFRAMEVRTRATNRTTTRCCCCCSRCCC